MWCGGTLTYTCKNLNLTLPLPGLHIQQVYGATCLYDKPLYSQSDKALGFDFCQGSAARMQTKAWDGDEFTGTDFNEGFYVFEDNFDDWHNLSYYNMNEKYIFNEPEAPGSTMASAK